eukprot:CAMPEP_0181291826 /NCGR_PEP_ID=MMETSP1101-20121128/2178_1 /TAXON_ID=46948 /ORGANISM="Rhodomonas abbreviata, Strain Caron Lab Isolate" /LENGTH=443 /DNA_ID=CAMNT_0023396251 /DNA_START=117 /DNA_END=1448 /DNA_ORIENTATION=-
MGQVWQLGKWSVSWRQVSVGFLFLLTAVFESLSVPLAGGHESSSADSVGRHPTPINISVSPVVLIPGIGGSIISDKKSGLRVWIRLSSASFYFQRFMWGNYNVTTETMEPLPGQPETGPLLSGYGLDGIRNLDPSSHWPIYDFVVYYDAIIRVLQSQGWIAVFGVPWDWRQSMCWPPTMLSLKQTITTAMKKNGGRKVSLISHSMGGLVVKCFLAKYPDFFEQSVDAWVGIGTPHQGAGAKILLEFLQGYDLGNYAIKSEDAKALSLEAPSVYELLPQEEFPWQQPPFITMDKDGVAIRLLPRTYSQPIREALTNHTRKLPPDHAVSPEPFNDECFALSKRTRSLVASPLLPPSVRYYNVHGMGQATPLGLMFGNISRYEELTTKKYTLSNTDGDGTVPVESAVAHGMTARATLGVSSTHMALLQQKATIDLILRAVYDREEE